MLELLLSIFNKKKITFLEANQNESNAVLYCRINGKGYRIQMTPDENYDILPYLQKEMNLIRE